MLTKSKISLGTTERLLAQEKGKKLTYQGFPYPSLIAKVRLGLLGISPEEATFRRRGFHASNPQTQQRLETIGKTFLQGYHAAISGDRPEVLTPQLNDIADEWRGFAFEGAAMGLTLLDYLTPWQRNRRQQFLAGAGGDHIYMVYVGMGWALARLPWGVEGYLDRLKRSQELEVRSQKSGVRSQESGVRSQESGVRSQKSGVRRQESGVRSQESEVRSQESGVRSQESEVRSQESDKFSQSKIQNPKSIDPLLGWLALDGYGFHQGYFYWPKYVERIAIPERISGYGYHAFDQGLGRSIWFVKGADVTCIPQTIKNFQPSRRGNLWSGIGLASTYAGGADKEALQGLRTAAGAYLPQLAQGAAFAAKARQRAGNLMAHTEMACQVLCGLSAEEAAAITDRSLVDLPFDSQVPAYEIWRRRIQAQLEAVEVSK